MLSSTSRAPSSAATTAPTSTSAQRTRARRAAASATTSTTTSDPMPVDLRRELGDRALLALVVLLLLWWRLFFVGYGVDLDTDAYGHHVIARHLADHPADVGANWVWLPLFHYVQAIAVGMGATLRTIRWANAVIS